VTVVIVIEADLQALQNNTGWQKRGMSTLFPLFNCETFEKNFTHSSPV